MNLFQLVKAFKKKSLDSNNHHEYMIDSICSLKGIVHPKMKILSSFTHPQVVPNLNECLCSAEHKGRYSEECGKQSSSGAPLTSRVFFFPTMQVNGAPKQPDYKLSSKYLPLCSAEQRYRSGTTWGWVNDDRIFIFGWTIPLSHFSGLIVDSICILLQIKQMFVFLIFQSFSEMTFFSHLASLWPLILLI